jgi:hypothetical protein
VPFDSYLIFQFQFLQYVLVFCRRVIRWQYICFSSRFHDILVVTNQSNWYFFRIHPLSPRNGRLGEESGATLLGSFGRFAARIRLQLCSSSENVCVQQYPDSQQKENSSEEQLRPSPNYVPFSVKSGIDTETIE